MNVGINNKLYDCRITLRQDELLAPIIQELLNEIPESLEHAGRSVMNVFRNLQEGNAHIESLKSGDPEQIDLDAIRKNIESTHSTSVMIAMDMIKVQAWIYAKGYAKRIMAIILVPAGEEFNENNIAAQEELFGRTADRETANEVINYFFQRSGVFGIGIPGSLPKDSTK